MSTPFLLYQNDMETRNDFEARDEGYRSYQPPSPSLHRHTNKRDCGCGQTPNAANYLTDDHAFFQIGSYLLSLIGAFASNEFSSDQNSASIAECGISVENSLQQAQTALSFSEMEGFVSALDTRFKSLPEIPDPNERDLEKLVRQCNGLLKEPLARFMTERSNGTIDQMVTRYNDGRRGRLYPATSKTEEEPIYNFSPFSSNEKNSQIRTKAEDKIVAIDVPHPNDLTTNIVWDEESKQTGNQMPRNHFQNQYTAIDNQKKIATGENMKKVKPVIIDCFNKTDLTDPMIIKCCNDNHKHELPDDESDVVYNLYSNQISELEHEIGECGRNSRHQDSCSAITKEILRLNNQKTHSILDTQSAKNTIENREALQTDPILHIQPDVQSQSQQKFDNDLIRVVAPESLPEGFKFEARICEEKFLASVPKGGVLKGQVFSSPKMVLDNNYQYDPSSRAIAFVDMQPPNGRWRDGIFDCLKHGICHPMVLNSFICPQFTLSQIMARLQLNMSGERPENFKRRTRLKEIQLLTSLMITIHGIFIFLVVRSFFMYIPIKYVIYGFSPVFLIDCLMIVYFFHLVIKVRKIIRKNYKIPENCCYGWEDLCVSLFLTPCTLSQLGRHTVDYSTYVGLCCTDTGLPPHVESKFANTSVC